MLNESTTAPAKPAGKTLFVTCPVCRMAPGVRCEDHNGIEVATHRPRIEAAAPELAVMRLTRELAAAQAASDKASRARAALPAGSSRAKVTTANARWARAAEHRDRIAAELDAARVRATEAK